jgi:hypothetical protein
MVCLTEVVVVVVVEGMVEYDVAEKLSFEGVMVRKTWRSNSEMEVESKLGLPGAELEPLTYTPSGSETCQPSET